LVKAGEWNEEEAMDPLATSQVEVAGNTAFLRRYGQGAMRRVVEGLTATILT
jgi:hypothetical protein